MEKPVPLVPLPDPCSVPWCRSIPVGQRMFVHLSTYSFLILTKIFFFWWNIRPDTHFLLPTGLSYTVNNSRILHTRTILARILARAPPCLLPTMAYASDACFHLSTTCCTHAPPHALVLRSGLGYRSPSSPSIPAPASPLVLRSPLDVFPDHRFPCHLHAV